MNRLIKHRVNFYFFDFGKLPYYRIADEIIQWWNDCYDINTNRFFFIGNVFQKVKSYPQGGSGILPAEKFDFHVYIIPQVLMPRGVAGLSLFREDGGAVIVLGATASILSLYPLTHQFKNDSLHESGHCFGMAIGEFYKIRNVVDLTLAQPELKVSILKHDDYWSSPLRSDWKRDVMLNPNAAEPKWCPLNALCAKYGIWRESGPPSPDLTKIPIYSRVINTEVLVYRMDSIGYDLIGEYKTDDGGYFVFDWGCNHWEAVSNDQLRKIILKTPKPISYGLSIFDVQQAWLTARERAGHILTTSMETPYLVMV